MKKHYASLGMGLLLSALAAAQSPSQPSANVPTAGDGHHQAQDVGETTLYFPDYVDGGGWSVQLVLTNINTTAAAPAVVAVHDPGGQPVLDLFDSDLTVEIPALGSRVLRSTGSGAIRRRLRGAGSATIRRGWIQVETESSSVGGLLTYRHAESGIEVGVEPVEPGNHFALFVEESSEIGTGLAIFKPDSSSTIELRIRDEEGRDPLGEVVVFREDYHQRARTIPEWFDVDGIDQGFLGDFRGCCS